MVQNLHLLKSSYIKVVMLCRSAAILSEEKAKSMTVKMTIPASVEQEIRDKRVGKDAVEVDITPGSAAVSKREAGDEVKLETDPSGNGEPFVTKFGPAITTADLSLGPQG